MDGLQLKFDECKPDSFSTSDQRYINAHEFIEFNTSGSLRAEYKRLLDEQKRDFERQLNELRAEFDQKLKATNQGFASQIRDCVPAYCDGGVRNTSRPNRNRQILK